MQVLHFFSVFNYVRLVFFIDSFLTKLIREMLIIILFFSYCFQCNCSQRENCKTGPSIARAAFNGKSYARQHVDVEISNGNNATLRIFMRLRTRFKNGIILHVYFDNEKYALVYLEYGSLKFQFSCGLETMLLGEIDSPIDNGYEADIDTR